MTRPRVLLCYANLGPYHRARVAACLRRGMDLHIIETANVSTKYLWEPGEHEELGSRVFTLAVGRDARGSELAWRHGRVWLRVLDTVRPDAVVVAGYSRMEMVATAIASWARGVPVIVMSDSTAVDRPRVGLRERLKAAYCRLVFSGAYCAGERSAEYLKQIGLAGVPIVRGVDVVDNGHFQVAVESRRKAWPKRFVAVLRLSQEKNVSLLLRAFASYRTAGGTWDLELVGDGPDASKLREESRELGLLDVVHFSGWIGYEDLPAAYARAGCLVLPSLSEPWGLVVNEAMASGLPVVVSSLAGCVPELLEEDVNGWMMDPASLDGLSHTLGAVEEAGGKRLREMGEHSLEIVANFSVEAWAEGLEEIVERSGVANLTSAARRERGRRC